MRVGQKNSLVYQWAKKGTRPRQPKDQRYENAYLFGAVCPSRDTGVAIIMPYANTAAMRKTPRRDQSCRRTRRTRHGHSRPSGLAHHAQTQGPEKPHNGVAAAGLSGTQTRRRTSGNTCVRPISPIGCSRATLTFSTPVRRPGKAPRQDRSNRLHRNPRLGNHRSINMKAGMSRIKRLERFHLEFTQAYMVEEVFASFG
jgi:hypothetical protein